MFQSDDNISFFVSFFDIPVRLGHLFQRIASIYDSVEIRHLSRASPRPGKAYRQFLPTAARSYPVAGAAAVRVCRPTSAFTSRFKLRAAALNRFCRCVLTMPRYRDRRPPC